MLYAPLRTLLYADPDGDTQLAIDQPGLTFGSYDDSRIANVGRELDALLAQPISSQPSHELRADSGLGLPPGHIAAVR